MFLSLNVDDLFHDISWLCDIQKSPSSLGRIHNYGELVEKRERKRDAARCDIAAFFSQGAQFPVENSAKHNNDWR